MEFDDPQRHFIPVSGDEPNDLSGKSLTRDEVNTISVSHGVEKIAINANTLLVPNVPVPISSDDDDTTETTDSKSFFGFGKKEKNGAVKSTNPLSPKDSGDSKGLWYFTLKLKLLQNVIIQFVNALLTFETVGELGMGTML